MKCIGFTLTHRQYNDKAVSDDYSAYLCSNKKITIEI